MFIMPPAILAIENDDDRAFMEELYINHRGLMYGVALSYLHNNHDAQDAVNDAIVRLIDKIPELREKNSSILRPYIVSTVRRTCLNVIAKKKKAYEKTKSAEAEEIENVADEKAAVDIAVIANITYEALRKAVEKLPEKERTILQLRYFEEWSDTEISTLLEIAPSTVRVYLVRARRRMYEILSRQGIEYEQ